MVQIIGGLALLAQVTGQAVPHSFHTSLGGQFSAWANVNKKEYSYDSVKVYKKFTWDDQKYEE